MIRADDLAGRTALVTGASSGLGMHFARVLAAAGVQLVLAARRRDRLDALAAEIGGAARAVTLDISEASAVRDAVASIGVVDILVNNAGVTIDKPALDQDEADYDHVLDVNLRGCFLVATACARAMRDAGRPGSIINVASILGLRQANRVAPYAMAKAGVIQMTKSLALELARHRIRVNAIAPGYVSTELNADFLASETGQVLRKRVPQRRFGELDDLNGALLLLASDASAYMTGSVIAVDGGHLVSTL